MAERIFIMKKILSCLLAVIMAFSCLGIAVYAADTVNDNYTKSYFVDVAPNFRSMIRIRKYDPEQGVPDKSDPDYVDPGYVVYYVKPGEKFQFTLEVGGGYRMDQSTVVKYANTHKQADMITHMDDQNGNYDNGTIIYPDANGVYTIPEVNEDIYVYTGLLNKRNISDVKDFLMNLFGFFRDLLLWFFGVR